MSLLILLLQEVLNMALLLVRMVRAINQYHYIVWIWSARCGVFKEQKLDVVDLLSGFGIKLSPGSDLQKLLDAFHRHLARFPNAVFMLGCICTGFYPFDRIFTVFCQWRPPLSIGHSGVRNKAWGLHSCVLPKACKTLWRVVNHMRYRKLRTHVPFGVLVRALLSWSLCLVLGCPCFCSGCQRSLHSFVLPAQHG